MTHTVRRCWSLRVVGVPANRVSRVYESHFPGDEPGHSLPSSTVPATSSLRDVWIPDYNLLILTT